MVPTMVSRTIKLAPSILSADFARLGEVIRETTLAGADRIHIDVMDGHFVPNLTFGPMIVDAIRPHTSIPLEVHVMVQNPGSIIPDLVSAGADIITVHQEAVSNPLETVQTIQALQCKAGVAINPSTPISVLEPILSELDLVLVMGVNPGFGGQAFIPDTLPKLRKMRTVLDESNLDPDLEVDGGIKVTNIDEVIKAGANVIVAGSAVYSDSQTISEAITSLHKQMQGTA